MLVEIGSGACSCEAASHSFCLGDCEAPDQLPTQALRSRRAKRPWCTCNLHISLHSHCLHGQPLQSALRTSRSRIRHVPLLFPLGNTQVDCCRILSLRTGPLTESWGHFCFVIFSTCCDSQDALFRHLGPASAVIICSLVCNKFINFSLLIVLTL